MRSAEQVCFSKFNIQRVVLAQGDSFAREAGWYRSFGELSCAGDSLHELAPNRGR